MLKKILVIAMLNALLIGCSFGKSDTKSDWIVLEKAESVACSTWPKRAKDLEISEISFQTSSSSFLVKGTNRNTSRFSYELQFDNDEDVDPQDRANFEIGRSAQIAGLVKVGGADQFVVFEDRQGKTQVEFRNTASNTVELSFATNERQLTPLGIYPSNFGVWISYKNADQVVRFVFVDHRIGKNAKPVFSSLNFSDAPKVNVSEADGRIILTTVDDRQKTKFSIVSIDIKGKASEKMAVTTNVTYQIESYATYFNNGNFYIAYVDGDSLVGESTLKLVKAGIEGGAVETKWTRQSSLRNVHVNEPVFVYSKKGLELLVLKWVDEESTIARYMVTADGLGKPTYAGVFKRGSRIMDAFSVDAGRAFAVTRSKGSDNWEFLVCRL
jgi:hypothetical protein